MSQPVVPLYRRLMDHLLEEIDAGRLQPGQQILSERELADQFDMSRMTVRHALNELVNQGVLFRHQGKGTFVGRPKIRQKLRGLSSFTEDMLNRGLRPGGRVLSVEVVPASYRVRQALGLAEHSHVVRVERLRLADGEPMALENTHLPYPRFAGLIGEKLEDLSLYKVLQDRFNVSFGTALQAIEPAQADTNLARTLWIEEGSLLLLLERTTFAQQGDPVEFATSYYRADRYRFEVELNRR
ncbi:MAG: GntR family transcriptional regulator [Bacillota bacterium]